jgi:H+/Cl- antiporter ClcA
MNKSILSIILIIVGIVLIISGISATQSFSSNVSKFFTGAPTDKAIWMLIGGIIVAALGLFTMGRGRKA